MVNLVNTDVNRMVNTAIIANNHRVVDKHDEPAQQPVQEICGLNSFKLLIDA